MLAAIPTAAFLGRLAGRADVAAERDALRSRLADLEGVLSSSDSLVSAGDSLRIAASDPLAEAIGRVIKDGAPYALVYFRRKGCPACAVIDDARRSGVTTAESIVTVTLEYGPDGDDVGGATIEYGSDRQVRRSAAVSAAAWRPRSVPFLLRVDGRLFVQAVVGGSVERVGAYLTREGLLPDTAFQRALRSRSEGAALSRTLANYRH